MPKPSTTTPENENKPAEAGAAPADGAGQGADLGDLIGSLAQGEQREERQQQAQAEEAQKADGLERDIVDLAASVRPLLRPLAWWLDDATFDALWGDRVFAAAAEPGAALMRRHGIAFGDAMRGMGPWLGLATALGPSVAGTVITYRQARAAEAKTVVRPTPQEGPADARAQAS
jgi:hypothetical protein